MRVLRAKLVADTAFFARPRMLVDRQPTYKVPPISTVYGILLSIAHEPFDESEIKIGFLFYSDGATKDEVNYIYNITKKKEERNVFKKELLFNVRLEMYIVSDNEKLLEKFNKWFESPKNRVFMGSSDHFAEIIKSGYVKVCKKPKNYFAGPGLYPVSWIKYFYDSIGETMSYYIVPPERKEVHTSRFLVLQETQKIKSKFEIDKDILGDYIIVPTFDRTAKYYNTKYRVVYLWPVGKSALNYFQQSNVL